jgi:type IV pilus assembly protein PilV
MDFTPQTGFTLTEILISVFVLALGVIGAAGMQLSALRTTQQSAFHTSALELAADMADKMRANTAAMKQPDNPYLKVDYQSVVDNGGDAGPHCYGVGANCDPQQLAEFDIREWKKRIKASLPDGRAVICRDAAPWNDKARELSWTCSAATVNTGSLVIKIGWQSKNPDGSLIRDEGKQFAPSVALTVEPYAK